MKTKFLLLIAILFFSVTSCNTNDDNIVIDEIICTTVYVYGLNVRLIDATNSNIITNDVEIKATDGDYEEILMTTESSETFFGAGERAGNYTLTVTSSNYQTYTSDIIAVGQGLCHVTGQLTEISLTPN